jgi:hypothetical protein
MADLTAEFNREISESNKQNNQGMDITAEFENELFGDTISEVAKPKEASWGTVLKQVPASAAANWYESVAGIKDLLGNKEGAEATRRGVSAARKAMIEEGVADPTSVKGFVQGGLGSVYTQAPAMALGLLTGGSAIPLSIMGTQAGTQKMSNLTESDIPYYKAAPLSAISGAIEVVTEKLPFDTLLSMVKNNKGNATKFIKMMLSEQVGEQAATFADQIIDLVKPGQTLTWEDVKKNAIATAGSTAVQTTLTGGLAHGASKLVNKGNDVTEEFNNEILNQTTPDAQKAVIEKLAGIKDKTVKNRRDIPGDIVKDKKAKDITGLEQLNILDQDEGPIVVEEASDGSVVEGGVDTANDAYANAIESQYKEAETENGQVQTKTKVISETPSVQKLNKGPLSEEEFKRLKNTNVFIPEELEAIKKLPGFKQREKYNRTFRIIPKVNHTPDEIAKAQELYNKVEEAAKAVQATKVKINKKDKVSDEDVIKITELEKELKDVNDLILNTPVDQLTTEQEAMLVDVLAKLKSADIGGVPDIGPNILVDENGNTYPEVSPKVLRKLNIRDRVNALREAGKFIPDPARVNKQYKQPKPIRDISIEDIEDIEGDIRDEEESTERTSKSRSEELASNRERLEGSAEEWEAKLEAEGMPAELRFDEKKSELANLIDKILGFFKSDKQKAAETWKAVSEIIDSIEGRRTFIRDHRRAKNLLTDANQIIFKRVEDAIEWNRKVTILEDHVAYLLENKRSAFSRKEIARALRTHEITKEEYDYANFIFSLLKQQPLFEVKYDRNLKFGTDGTYSFAGNLIRLKDTNALAHEVMHYAYHNVLTKEDRKAYRDSFIQSYYDVDGNLMRDKLSLATTDSSNALKSPAELFACKGSDLVHDKVMTQTELSLFEKVKNWFVGLKQKLLNKGGSIKFEAVDQLYGKILNMEGGRTYWEEGNAISQALNTDNYNSHINNSLNSIISILSNIRKTITIASQPTPGSNVIAEIQGPANPQTQELMSTPLYSPHLSMKDVLWKNLGHWISSPVNYVKNTINELHVYNLNKAELFIAHVADKHRTDLDLIKSKLVKAGGDPNNIRRIIEKEITGTPSEIEAAAAVKQWLDIMKERIKLAKLNDYKKNLTNNEYAALMSIISGTPVEEVQKRYTKISLKTIQGIADAYKKIDTWGLDDYVPKSESGRFKLVATQLNSEGEAYTKLAAVGLTIDDAVRKAEAYIEKNPQTVSLQIDTDYKMLSDDKTAISSKHYYTIMGKLAKEMSAAIQEINDKLDAKTINKQGRSMASAAMKRKFKITPTNSFSPFLEPRKDVMEGEKDIFPVLQSYAYSIEKKLALDPVIELIRKDLPKMDKYEKAFILDFVEDVKGKYGLADKILDDVMVAFAHTGLARRLKLNIKAQRTYSRLIGNTRTLEAKLKLGYRPVAAAVNFASGQGHTWVKRGTQLYIDGIKFLNTPEGKAFAASIDEYLGTSYVGTDIDIKAKTKWHDALGLFQMPEPYNRLVSAAAAYQQGIKEGMSKEAAEEFAIRANWAEQFTYNIANLPKIMRGPTGKLLTQFKPYLIKEIEFIMTLTGREWIRYAALQFALGGPRGYLLIMKSLPVLSFMPWWEDAMEWIEEWMNKNAPLASRGVAGLPGVIHPSLASDISAAATFQFPRGTMDFVGPALNDIKTISEKVLAPMFTYGPEVTDLLKGGEIIAGMKHWSRLMQYVFSEDNWVLDDKGMKLYEVTEAIPFILQSVAGIENADLNMIRSEQRILANRDERIGGLKTRIINETMKTITDGKPISEDLRLKIIKNGVTAQSIINRVYQSKMTPRQRAILNTEIRRRMEVVEMFPVYDEPAYTDEQNYGLSEQ